MQHSAPHSYVNELLDPQFFIQTCLSIVNKNSQRVPFILNALQNKWWSEHTALDIIIKARKMGFSAVISAIWLHACIFKQNTRAVMVSHEDESTKRLLERVRYYIDTCKIPIKTQKNSEREISFPDTNSTFWIGTAGQRAFGRGDDITHLHLSEFTQYPNFDIVTGVTEAMRNDGIIVCESTANGAGNDSHKFWLNAINGESNYRGHFYGWWEDPEYCDPDHTPFELVLDEKEIKDALGLSWGQIRWRRKKIADMAQPEKFPQEYPASWEEAFLTSGQAVFKWQDLKRQEAGMLTSKWTGELLNTGRTITIEPQDKGRLTIWRTPRNRA